MPWKYLSSAGHKLGLRFWEGLSPPGNILKEDFSLEGGDFSLEGGAVPPCNFFLRGMFLGCHMKN